MFHSFILSSIRQAVTLNDKPKTVSIPSVSFGITLSLLEQQNKIITMACLLLQLKLDLHCMTLWPDLSQTEITHGKKGIIWF